MHVAEKLIDILRLASKQDYYAEEEENFANIEEYGDNYLLEDQQLPEENFANVEEYGDNYLLKDQQLPEEQKLKELESYVEDEGDSFDYHACTFFI